MLKHALPTVLILTLSGPALAGGHDGVPPEVKARNGLMANYSFNLGILGDMAKGKTDYDAATAAVAAANLAALTATDQSLLWTAGTDSDSLEGSRALPKIWDDQAGFQKAMTGMEDAAKAMAAVAGTDLDGLRGAIGGVGEACGTCHKPYRKPK